VATDAGACVCARARARARPCTPLLIAGNIKDSQFGPDFFSQFGLVLNALDNLDARRHVNRLCLATERLLLESGTQGYLGQVYPIIPQRTECFECQPQPAQKTFAVCTIRNTPDQPVHCIVWAKFIYAALFGQPDEGNIMSDMAEQMRRARDEDAVTAARRIFTQLFQSDVEASLRVEERWKNRRAPQPMALDALLPNAPRSADPAAWLALAGEGVANDQVAWTAAQNAAVFMASMLRVLSERRSELGSLAFDKDDDVAMDLVCSAANLRMESFHIATQSRFAAKGIAGQIVHAIATTNAMAAGLLVLEALKLLAGRQELCVRTWIRRSGPKVLQPQTLEKPQASCYACGKATLRLSLDVHSFTLRALFERVLVRHLGMNEPAIDVVNKNNAIGPQSEHEDEYLSRPLSARGINVSDGEILVVEDFSQKFGCNILVRHRVLDAEQHPAGFVLEGSASAESDDGEAKRPPPAETAEPGAATRVRVVERDGALVIRDDDDVDDKGEDGEVIALDDEGSGGNGGNSGGGSSSSSSTRPAAAAVPPSPNGKRTRPEERSPTPPRKRRS
jgi:ubiquitin-like 1-activating enzyme E1 B